MNEIQAVETAIRSTPPYAGADYGNPVTHTPSHSFVPTIAGTGKHLTMIGNLRDAKISCCCNKRIVLVDIPSANSILVRGKFAPFFTRQRIIQTITISDDDAHSYKLVHAFSESPRRSELVAGRGASDAVWFSEQLQEAHVERDPGTLFLSEWEPDVSLPFR